MIVKYYKTFSFKEQFFFLRTFKYVTAERRKFFFYRARQYVIWTQNEQKKVKKKDGNIQEKNKVNGISNCQIHFNNLILRSIRSTFFFSSRSSKSLSKTKNKYLQTRNFVNKTINEKLIDVKADKKIEDFFSQEIKKKYTKTPKGYDKVCEYYIQNIENLNKVDNIEIHNIILESVFYWSKYQKKNVSSIRKRVEIFLGIILKIFDEKHITPNKETFDLAIKCLLTDANDMIMCLSRAQNGFHFNEIFNYSQKLGIIASELIFSIDKKELFQLQNLDLIFVNLLKFFNYHNDLITKKISDFFTEVVAVYSIKDRNLIFDFYFSLISIYKYLVTNTSKPVSSEEKCKVLISYYNNYKLNNPVSDDFKNKNLFILFQIFVQSLVYNENVGMSSYFLDMTLDYYKKSFNNPEYITKVDVSNLFSSFFHAFLNEKYRNSNFAVLESIYKLIQRFNNITYFPEFSIELYENLIFKLICEFNKRSLPKVNPNGSALKNDFFTNENLYQVIMKLYNYIAIRKDFYFNSDKNYERKMIFNNKIKTIYNITELVLLLNINNKNDIQIFRLTKEIILKNHIIYDISILQKLLNYFKNRLFSVHSDEEIFNKKVLGLIWNLIEIQGLNYINDGRHLNKYFFSVLEYLQINSPFKHKEYFNCNFEFFVNSRLIKSSISFPTFYSCNFYPISFISDFLFTFDDFNNIKILNKILHFQSIIKAHLLNSKILKSNIDEKYKTFLLNFEEKYKLFFRKITDFNQFKVSQEILNITKSFEIDFENKSTSLLELKYFYVSDISYLLEINYEVGVKKFVNSFEKCNFTYSSWRIVCNFFFINDILKKNIIPIYGFFERLFKQDFCIEKKVSLLIQILNYHDDKINIILLKFVLQNINLFGNFLDKIVSELILHATGTKNIYLKNLLIDDFLFFKTIYSKNKEIVWIGNYLSFLSNKKVFLNVSKTFQELNVLETIIPNNLITNQIQFDLIINYLKILIKNDLNEFNSIIKKFLSLNKINKKFLISSSSLIILHFKYQLLKKSLDYQLFYKKISLLKDQNNSLTDLFYFFCFLNNNQKPSEINKMIDINVTPKTLNQLSLYLLTVSSDKISDNFNQNIELIKNKNDYASLCNLTLSNLLIATVLNQDTNTLIQKSLTFFDFSKFKFIKHSSIIFLIDLINLITLLNLKHLLNLILIKFLNNDDLANVLQLFSITFYFKNYEDQIRALEVLNNSFRNLNDQINIYKIELFCKKKKIKFCYNETVHQIKENYINNLFL